MTWLHCFNHHWSGAHLRPHGRDVVAVLGRQKTSVDSSTTPHITRRRVVSGGWWPVYVYPAGIYYGLLSAFDQRMHSERNVGVWQDVVVGLMIWKVNKTIPLVARHTTAMSFWKYVARNPSTNFRCKHRTIPRQFSRESNSKCATHWYSSVEGAQCSRSCLLCGIKQHYYF